MDPQTLYIMCGLPFSGKSTVSKNIAELTGAERVSFDETWIEIEDTIPKDPNEGWAYVRKYCQKKIGELLEEGKSVVYDDMNIRNEHRQELIKIAKDKNIEFKILYLKVDLEEIRQREATNLEIKERHTVNEKNFNNALEQLQEPTEQEHLVVL